MAAIALVIFASVAVKTISPTAKAVFAAAIAKTERLLPIYCVETENRKWQFHLTRPWGADDTDKLLQILADNDVKTTFFMCGYWVDKYPEEVKKIAEAGRPRKSFGNASSYEPADKRTDKRGIDFSRK